MNASAARYSAFDGGLSIFKTANGVRDQVDTFGRQMVATFDKVGAVNIKKRALPRDTYAQLQFGRLQGFKSTDMIISPRLASEAPLPSLRRDIRTGFKVPANEGEEIVATVAHEFGHHLDTNLPSADRHALFTRIAEHFGIDDTKRPTREIFDDIRPYIDKDTLSKYGATNDMEMIAECWSEYWMSPNPRPLAQLVGDSLIEFLGRKP